MTSINGNGNQLPLENLNVGKVNKNEPNNSSTTQQVSKEHPQNNEISTKDGKLTQELKNLMKKPPADLNKLKFFDHDLKDAKALLGDMMAGQGNVAANHFQMSSLIERMDKKELASFAKHVKSLMNNTDGKDEMLSKILDMTLNEMQRPDDNHFPDKPEILLKYTCSYSTKFQIA